MFAVISSKQCIIIKTIIRFGFCDIQNNQSLGKCYQPRPSARLITLTSTLIIPDITKPHPIIVYNYHRNYMNGTFRTTNTQSCSDQSIDLCILWDACHELFRAFEDFYPSGTQDAKATKSLESHCCLPRPTVK